MYNIALKNGNVFQNYYNVYMSYTARSLIASTSVTATTRKISDFKNCYRFFPFYNKYLRNDQRFISLSTYSRDNTYRIYKRDNSGDFYNPDLIKSLSSRYFNVQRSITGLRYEYISNSGWFFPFQNAVIVKSDLISTSSFTGSQRISYYMAQSSFYTKINDFQANYSYNCLTRVSYNSVTANQFIKGRPVYITTIALKDDDNNILAIGKFSKPIQKLKFIPMSFKIRFFS